MTAPISLCMIVRNEATLLRTYLPMVRPHVAEICVVDTGSEDDTLAVSRSVADKVETYTGCNDAQGRILDFADARRFSFSLATQPWVMWMDGDDELQNPENLKDLVAQYEDARRNGPVCIMAPYEYAHDGNGKCIMLHYRERIMSPKDAFKWVNQVHEVLIPIAGSQQFTTDAVRWIHHRDKSNKPVEPGRNLRILKDMYAKHGESDARHMYYLGIEYGNNGDIDNSLKFLKRYFELSGWDEEKFMACLEICKHHMNRAEYTEARDWALKATTVRETWGEAYFIIAKCCYFLAQRGEDAMRNWQRCVHFAQLGLSLPPTKTVLFVNPLERDFEIYQYLNVAQNNLGDLCGALDSCRQGLKARPNDGSLKLNESIYERFLLEQTVQHAANRMHELGHVTIEARDLGASLLKGHVQVPAVLPAPQAEEPTPVVRVSSKKDLILYVGPGVESWNPETARRTGIGGSETAVVEMSKRFASMGHRVRVYGDCKDLEGSFDGVEYLHHDKFKNTSCDVLITSRRPQAVDEELGVKARATLCWVHDIHCGSALTHPRALRIDKFLCLSNWHKEFFLSQHECVHPSQVLVTRNGIDLARFQDPPIRDPRRAVYSSSPDRGMQVAITVWPLVREKVPGAELHIYYGFQTWESCADDSQRQLIAQLKKMLRDYETAGVVFHGRVSQQELAREYMRSGVWAYPTWFSETSCISAMEAHAAGLRMVTSPIAALNETVGSRGTMVPGDWLSWDYQAKFVDAVVAAMQRTDNSDRESLRQYARDHFSWDGVAQAWDGMFDGIIQERAVNIMPPYKGIR